MINRIRDIRLQKGLTLADVAIRCDPPTTAQTIGRLETGMRNLSLVWMNRIAAALGVEPESLLRSEGHEPARIVASLGPDGPEALKSPREAILPEDIAGEGPSVVLAVEASCGEYRKGDLVWLRQHRPEQAASLLNRDVLAPEPGGRFAFGRLVGIEDGAVTLMPPTAGRPPVSIASPAWLAAADMLVRKL